jgi:hypothetical protein
VTTSTDQEDTSDYECDSETEDPDQDQADHETEDSSGGVAAWFDVELSAEQGNQDDQEVIHYFISILLIF